MLLIPFLLLFQVDLAKIDQMAKNRDVGGLSKILAPLPKGVRNPLTVLKSNGPYETGSKGWRALGLQTPDGSESFIVLSTPLTSQDVGELVFHRNGDRLEYIQEADSLGVRIMRHDFDISLWPEKLKVEIVDRLVLKKTGQTKSFFFFRLSPGYKVGSISGNSGKSIPFRQAGGTVVLSIPSSVETTFVLHYSASPDLPQFAGSIGRSEATLTNDYWYPMVARLPAPYTLRVSAPKAWTIVAQGEPLGKVVNGDRQVARFRMDLPVTYYSLSAGPYRTMSQVFNGMWYSVWGPNLTEENMRTQLAMLPLIVDFYERKFGVWPFKRYGFLQSPGYGGGALEAYSYATYGGGLPEEDPHEPSHTLFGGVLGNTYLKSFWNESFAAFCEGFYQREVGIGNNDERRLAFVQTPGVNDDYDAAPIAEGDVFLGPPASTLGYGKGGYVLQMLERLIGTDAFVASVKRWITDQPAGEPTAWEGFEKAVSRVSADKSVKRFFDDWVHRAGYPKFNVSSVRQDSSGLAFRVVFDGKPFLMPVDVMTVGDDGKREFFQVIVESSGDVVVHPTSATKLVSIDPWRRLVRKLDPSETPVELATNISKMRTYIDPMHGDYLSDIGRPIVIRSLPNDLNGVFLIGHPNTTPEMKELCSRVGFEVAGDQLTYKGTTIDLNDGAAMAVVDLPNGGHCAIGLGKTLLSPRFGRARLALVDRFGRYLRGVTEAKTSGKWVYKL